MGLLKKINWAMLIPFGMFVGFMFFAQRNLFDPEVSSDQMLPLLFGAFIFFLAMVDSIAPGVGKKWWQVFFVLGFWFGGLACFIIGMGIWIGEFVSEPTPEKIEQQRVILENMWTLYSISAGVALFSMFALVPRWVDEDTFVIKDGAFLFPGDTLKIWPLIRYRFKHYKKRVSLGSWNVNSSCTDGGQYRFRVSGKAEIDIDKARNGRYTEFDEQKFRREARAAIESILNAAGSNQTAAQVVYAKQTTHEDVFQGFPSSFSYTIKLLNPK